MWQGIATTKSRGAYMEYTTQQDATQEEQAAFMPEEVTGQTVVQTAPAVLRGFSAHKAAGKLSSLSDPELKVAEKVWGRENLKTDKLVLDLRIPKGVISNAINKLLKLGYLVAAGSHKSSTYAWKPDKK